MTTTSSKLEYGKWQKGRAIINELQQKYGMSLTAISRAVKGSGDTPGWADAAREYRGMMMPEHYETLRDLLRDAKGEPSENGDGHGEVEDRPLNEAENNRYRGILMRLRDVYGFSQAAIADQLPISEGQVSKHIRGLSGTTMLTLMAADSLLQRVSKTTAAPKKKAGKAPKKPAVEKAAEETPEPEPTPTPEPVAEKPDAPTETPRRGEFETQLALARATASEMIDALEMLAVVSPAFARKGVDDLIERATALHSDLEG